MAEQTLWTSYTPAITDANDSQQYGLGTTFYSVTPGWVLGVKWRFPDTLPSGSVTAKLWRNDGDDTLLASGTELASATFSAPVAGTVNEVRFVTPIAISANVDHVVSIKTPDRYVATSGYDPWDTGSGNGGVVSGDLRAPENGTDPLLVGTLHNGKLNDLTGHQYPYQTFSNANYWVDVIFTTDNPAGEAKDGTDAFTLNEAWDVVSSYSATDTATASEAQTLAVSVALAEPVTATDTENLAVATGAADQFLFGESWSLEVFHTAEETVTATESPAPLGIEATDSFSATEAWTLAVTLAASEIVTAVDSGARQIEGQDEVIPTSSITIVRRNPQITIQKIQPQVTIMREN